MEESEHGDYMRHDYHTHEINEYIRIDANNRNLAETLLKEQDAELARKNKEIFKLELQVEELLNAG